MPTEYAIYAGSSGHFPPGPNHRPMNPPSRFLPTTSEELKSFGWPVLDVILVTGDTYIDSPFLGTAIIGRLLVRAGYRVGIIAQPVLQSDRDITRLGEPRLFWGITAGSVDSMVSNYTALRKKRRRDDFTPGGINDRRPDRATIAYSNLIRRCYKQTKPLVLGGIEASLRRIAHYDYWDDEIRRSILFDAKADLLVYGMAEKTILEVAGRLERKEDFGDIRGICYSAGTPKEGYLLLPDYETVKTDPAKLTEMFHLFYQNTDPYAAQGLCQRQDTRYLIQTPPSEPLSEKEMDSVYDMAFTRDVHPYYKRQGVVRAQETIQWAMTTHRGCFGECNFCAIAMHQGRIIQSRSVDSICNEAQGISRLPAFKGYITDVGGPTANMYGMNCSRKGQPGVCRKKRCLYPEVCRNLKSGHARQIDLLRKLRSLPGIRKVFVASGIRHDLIMEDRQFGILYLQDLIRYHVSGQLKIAPEHTEEPVLRRMGKCGSPQLLSFKKLFDGLNRESGKKQFLTYYLLAAHPGCSEQDMEKLRQYFDVHLKIRPEQVQIFTPTPSTYSTLMFATGKDPFSGETLFIEKDSRKKERQKEWVVPRRDPLQDKHRPQ